jgi:cobalt transporter subunit CbtA
MGLPPEVPGSGTAALEARQLWWLFAVAATGIGIAGLVLGQKLWMQAGGIGLIALPHIVGAPRPLQYMSTAPAELAAEFAATSLAVTAIFWAVLGYASGAIYRRLSRGG